MRVCVCVCVFLMDGRVFDPLQGSVDSEEGGSRVVKGALNDIFFFKLFLAIDDRRRKGRQQRKKEKKKSAAFP